LSFT